MISFCRVCACKHFVAQYYRDKKCKECFHSILEHTEATVKYVSPVPDDFVVAVPEKKKEVVTIPPFAITTAKATTEASHSPKPLAASGSSLRVVKPQGSRSPSPNPTPVAPTFVETTAVTASPSASTLKLSKAQPAAHSPSPSLQPQPQPQPLPPPAVVSPAPIPTPPESPKSPKSPKVEVVVSIDVNGSKDSKEAKENNKEESEMKESGEVPSSPAPERKSKRFYIVQEILATEKSYVDSLFAIVHVFIANVRTISDTLSEHHYQPIFSNVEEILPVNKQLLSELEARWKDWTPTQSVGDVFLNIIPYLKTYTNYTAQYSDALIALRECDKHSAFQAVMAKCASQCKLGLESLIIQPVQRIPRYNLLLADLLKNTETDHPDYGNIESALKKMQDVANNINESIRESENRRKVLEIQTNLHPVDCLRLVEPHRAFVREGYLTKVCRKTNKKFMFYLFSDMLIYAEQNAVLDKFVFHRMFPLDTCRFEDTSSETNPHSFVIASAQKSFAVFAETAEQKEEWFTDLNTQSKNLIQRKESFKNRTGENSADSDVAEAPVWVPDDHTSTCSLCKEGFSFVRRRHHCRVCGQVVCAKCSDKKLKIPALDPKNDVRVCTPCYQKRRPLGKSDTLSRANLLEYMKDPSEKPESDTTTDLQSSSELSSSIDLRSSSSSTTTTSSIDLRTSGTDLRTTGPDLRTSGSSVDGGGGKEGKDTLKQSGGENGWLNVPTGSEPDGKKQMRVDVTKAGAKKAAASPRARA